MNVFDRIKSRSQEHASRKTFDSLEKRVKLTVYKFSQRQSEYPNKDKQYPMNLVAFFHGNKTTLRHYITMPSLYNDMPEADVQELNECIKNKTPPSIVYYGKDGPRNVVDILKHDEDIDLNKAQEFIDLESVNKRPHDDDDDDDKSGSSRKRSASENSLSSSNSSSSNKSF